MNFTIIGMEEGLLDKIVSRVVVAYQPEKIILFGSYARGTATEDSDLDLLLIKQTNEAPVNRAREVRLSLREFLFPMDILVYTPDEFEESGGVKYSFISGIKKYGKILYEK
jgi:uncharacterized protein